MRPFRPLRLALVLFPCVAFFGAAASSANAGASTARPEVAGTASTAPGSVPGTLVLQAVGCSHWSAVPANDTPPDPLDDTAGHYVNWGPLDRQRVAPVAAHQLTGCTPLDGVTFELSGTEFGNGLASPTTPDGRPVYAPEATGPVGGATGDSGAGTLDVALASLSAPQRAALVDGTGLWVQATGFPGDFANLRCHEDRYNADNLEVIRVEAGGPLVAACVLYAIVAMPVTPQNVAPPAAPVVTVPPIVSPPQTPPPTIPAVVEPGPTGDLEGRTPLTAPVPPEAPADPASLPGPGPLAAPVPDAGSPVPLLPTEGGARGVSDPDNGVADGSLTADRTPAQNLAPTTTTIPVDLLPDAVPTATTPSPRTEPTVVARPPTGSTTTVMTSLYIVEEPVEQAAAEQAAAGAAAPGGEGLDAAAVTALTAVFLAGLGLSVLAARRPL